MSRQLTVEAVTRIYDAQIGVGPLRDPGALENAVRTPFQHVFGRELYPTVPLKTAKLIDGISRAQAYQDGNKRLAWLSGTILLQVNGLVLLDIDDVDVEQFVLSLDGGETGLRAAALWINARVHATT